MRTFMIIAASAALAACGSSSPGGTTGSSSGTAGSGSSSGGTSSGGAGTTGTFGSVAAPVPKPPPGLLYNDVKLALTSDTPGATICYTLDGSTPACAAGMCQGSTATYSAKSEVAIDGTVTSTSPGAEYGTVTVNALACKDGWIDGLAAPATYSLLVDQPSFSNPSTANSVLYGSSGNISPTLSSTTMGASAYYTTTGSDQPSCTSGTEIASLPAQVSFAADQGMPPLFIIGCKAGYQPSMVGEALFNFFLNPPTFSPGSSKTFDANTAVQIDDTANAGSDDEVCFTSDGTLPSCGCGAGNQRPGGITSSLAVVNRTDSGFQAIACPIDGGIFRPSSNAPSGNYTLQLDPIAFNPASGTTIPYVSQSMFVSIEQSGDGSGEPYDYICWNTSGPAPDCTCANGTQTDGNSAVAMANAPSATIQAVGCLSAGGADAYLPSNSPAAVATYILRQMAAPAINPGNGVIASNPQPVTFTNNDPAASAYFCFSVDGSVPAPCVAPGVNGCTMTYTAPAATSTDGPAVTVSGTEVRVVACDVEAAKSPSNEPAPITFK